MNGRQESEACDSSNSLAGPRSLDENVCNDPWEPECSIAVQRIDQQRTVYIRYHREMLMASVVVLIAAVFITTPDNLRVEFPGGWTVPELCMVKAWTGNTCPGCGLTRSFIHVFDGHWASAFDLHPLGPLFVATVIGQIPYRAYRIHSLSHHGSVVAPQWATWFGRSLIAMLIGVWLIRAIL